MGWRNPKNTSSNFKTMGDNALCVAFLWHMHQPYYKDPFTGVYRLPWVRLHGIKDYLDMAKILEEFPKIRQTFNLVPSLLEQLTDYVENNAKDEYLELSLKNPTELSENERLFIIENFFFANWENMIKPWPRYYELLTKRGFRFSKKDTARVLKYFTEGDIRDLQVLFNLSWIDPMFRKGDPFFTGLLHKGEGFTEEEKHRLIERQIAILKEIIPEYKKLSQEGQIELSISPFYHPILPLLWDTDAASIAMPSAPLPRKRFAHPEDAIKQIQMGIDYFEKVFGYRPSGMWPSEGSVSEDIVRAIGAEGIRWIATDEEVLARSLQRPLRSHEGQLIDSSALYRPYEFNGVTICFRDRKLSDLIGFVYSSWKPSKAAEDFVNNLLQIRNTLPDDRPYLVSIILDGENAWEYYENDGHDFLAALYRLLSDDNRLRTVTISEFIKEHGPGDPLPRIHAGSWIDANFSIWIGHEEDNLAWDYLTQTRDDLKRFQDTHPEKDLSIAWKALYAAEGSDWNWWYGDEHSTETEADFDELFRRNLMKVYQIIEKDLPQYLYVPILLKDRSIIPSTQARGFIYPKIDGIVTSYFEWHQGAVVDVKRTGGSMHRSESLLSTIYYGFNKDNLYLRIDFSTPFNEMKDGFYLHINIISSTTFKVIFGAQKKSQTATLFEKVSDAWVIVKSIENVAAKDIFEIEIPFTDIKAKENDEIHFYLDIEKNDDESGSEFEGSSMERCPWRGNISLRVPSADFEKLMWF
ncbi:MAG: glycoside hydrolase [Dissulfurispiraceae bacterium]